MCVPPLCVSEVTERSTAAAPRSTHAAGVSVVALHLYLKLKLEEVPVRLEQEKAVLQGQREHHDIVASQ